MTCDESGNSGGVSARDFPPPYFVFRLPSSDLCPLSPNSSLPTSSSRPPTSGSESEIRATHRLHRPSRSWTESAAPQCRQVSRWLSSARSPFPAQALQRCLPCAVSSRGRVVDPRTLDDRCSSSGTSDTASKQLGDRSENERYYGMPPSRASLCSRRLLDRGSGARLMRTARRPVTVGAVRVRTPPAC